MSATMTPLSDTHHAQFMALAMRLSPENLHCDGEISRGEADRRFRALKKQWRALEREVGRPVEESELWARDRARADRDGS